MIGVSCVLTLVIALCLTSVVNGSTAQRTDCIIAINGGLPNPQPLLLKVNGSQDGLGFHLPANANGCVVVAKGEPIRLLCTGPKNYFKSFGSKVQEVIATCVSRTDFTVNNEDYTFRELACATNPYHTARPTGETCDNGEAVMIDVGFVYKTEFFRILEQCFDETRRNTLWSRFDCVPGIGGYQKKFPRTGFIADDFYPGISPVSLYSRKNQREVMSYILGSTTLGEKYISESDDFFLARGHLTGKADFVYGSQHRATFHFVNVAPQWQTFNGANWNQLEQDVRLFAASNDVHLVIYTGTHDIMTLPDVNEVQQEIWLSVDENNNKAIPVPRLYYKIVYNPITQEAIAFIGVNNPYVVSPENDASYTICENVCHEINWVKWDPIDIKKGYSYCCAVDDLFRSKIRALPDFTVSGLLT